MSSSFLSSRGGPYLLTSEAGNRRDKLLQERRIDRNLPGRDLADGGGQNYRWVFDLVEAGLARVNLHFAAFEPHLDRSTHVLAEGVEPCRAALENVLGAGRRFLRVGDRHQNFF